MKKLIILLYFFVFYATNVEANEINKKLNKLFDDLLVSTNVTSLEIEQKIWKLWSQHPTDHNLTLKLEEGSKLVRNNRLSKAIKIFNQVIDRDPNWAEAWNKRATVLYLLGDYEGSQKDIDKVLKLEKRHFGALSGQGLVQTAMKNYQKAIDSYIEAHKVYPAMTTPLMMIERLKEIIKKESI